MNWRLLTILLLAFWPLSTPAQADYQQQGNTIQFSYTWGSYSQTFTDETFTVTVINNITNKIGWDGEVIDTYRITFNGQTIEVTEKHDARDYVFTASGSQQITLEGIDNGFWGGYYGPIMTLTVMSEAVSESTTVSEIIEPVSESPMSESPITESPISESATQEEAQTQSSESPASTQSQEPEPITPAPEPEPIQPQPVQEPSEPSQVESTPEPQPLIPEPTSSPSPTESPATESPVSESEPTLLPEAPSESPIPEPIAKPEPLPAPQPQPAQPEPQPATQPEQPEAEPQPTEEVTYEASPVPTEEATQKPEETQSESVSATVETGITETVRALTQAVGELVSAVTTAGLDMTPEQREEAQEIVVSSVIVSQIAGMRRIK